MFLLQLLKMGKMQALLKNGYRLLRQHNFLREGDNRITVTLSFTDEAGRKAEAQIRADYRLGRLSRTPQILDIDTTDWTITE